MIFRTIDATIIGRQTAGADGSICYLPLPDDGFAIFSGVGVYYPDRSETQRIGILPDIEVYPTMESIKAGKDEILEAAIEYLGKQE